MSEPTHRPVGSFLLLTSGGYDDSVVDGLYTVARDFDPTAAIAVWRASSKAKLGQYLVEAGLLVPVECPGWHVDDRGRVVEWRA
jgi:hypothetical protein